MTATRDTEGAASWKKRLPSQRAATATAVGLVAFAAYAAGAVVMSVQDDEPLFADPARSAAGGLGYRTQLLEGLVPGVEIRLMWQPPGYPVLLSSWYRVVGFGLVEGRGLSVFAGTLTLAMIYLFARARASQTASLVSVLAVAVTPWFAGAATTIRPDAVTVFAVVATAFLLDRYLRDGDCRLLAALCVTATVALLVHPLGAIAPALVSITLVSARRWLAALAHALVVVSLVVALWAAFVHDQWELFITQMKLQGERKPPFNPLAVIRSEKRLIGLVPLVSSGFALSATRRWKCTSRVSVIGTVVAFVAATVGAENQYPVYLVALSAPLVALAYDSVVTTHLRKATIAIAAVLLAAIPGGAALVHSVLSSADVRAAQQEIRPGENLFLGPGGGDLYFVVDPARVRTFSPVPSSGVAVAQVLNGRDVLVTSLPPPTSPREMAEAIRESRFVSGTNSVGVWRETVR